MVDKLSNTIHVRPGGSIDSARGTPAEAVPRGTRFEADAKRGGDALEARPTARQAVSAQIARPLDGAFAAAAAYQSRYPVPPALAHVLQSLAKEPAVVRQLMAPFYY